VKAFGRALLLIITIALGVELLLRGTVGRDFGSWLVLDERNQLFMHDEELGWIGRPHARGEVQGAVTVSATLNSEGFRDPDLPAPGPLDVIFLGDSFVWGFDVEEGRRFTDLLRARQPALRLANLGVSGYGTDQEYLLLRRYFTRWTPRVVVLVFNGSNDREDNSSTERYFGYFKPAFTKGSPALIPIGIPVPRGLRYRLTPLHAALKESTLLRVLAATSIFIDKQRGLLFPDITEDIIGEIHSFTSKSGTKLVLALVDSDRKLEEFCAGLADLTCLVLPEADRFTSAGNHWTAAGHETIANALSPVLLSALASAEKRN
jgi:hypothetical protein